MTEVFVLISISTLESSSSLLSLIDFLWKSLLFYLQTRAIFAWHMWGVSNFFFFFFFLPAQQLLLLRTASTLTWNLGRLSFCVGLRVPVFPVEATYLPRMSSGMGSWNKGEKKRNALRWGPCGPGFLSLEVNSEVAPHGYTVSVLLYEPLDLVTWANKLPLFFKWRVPVPYNQKRAVLGLWRNVNFLGLSGPRFINSMISSLGLACLRTYSRWNGDTNARLRYTCWGQWSRFG